MPLGWLQEHGSMLLRLWEEFLNSGRHSGTIFKRDYLSSLPVCHGFPWSKDCRVRICKSSLVAHAGVWFMSRNQSLCVELVCSAAAVEAWMHLLFANPWDGLWSQQCLGHHGSNHQDLALKALGKGQQSFLDNHLQINCQCNSIINEGQQRPWLYKRRNIK